MDIQHSALSVGWFSSMRWCACCALWLCLLWTTLPISAHADTNISTRPAVTAVPTLLLKDLGNVDPGSTTKLTFTLINPSDRDITITSIEIPCACTHLPQRPSTIPARGTITVPVTFTAFRKVMDYQTQIILLTDSPQFPRMTLELKTRIGIPVVLEYSEIDLGIMSPGGTWSGQLNLVNDGSVPVRVVHVESSDEHLQVANLADPIGPNSAGKIALTLRAPEQSGVYEARIDLQTDQKRQRSHGAIVRYEVCDHLRFMPSRIELGDVGSESIQMFQVQVGSVHVEGPTIQDAALSTNDRFSGQVTVETINGQHTLSGTLKMGTTPGRANGVLAVTFNDGATFNIPINATIVGHEHPQ